jgi:hypothetical protein
LAEVAEWQTRRIQKTTLADLKVPTQDAKSLNPSEKTASLALATPGLSGLSEPGCTLVAGASDDDLRAALNHIQAELAMRAKLSSVN